MNKHTPGPWAVTNADTVVGPAGNVVAECCGYSVKAGESVHGQGGREANAKLIAAAPDLLAECRRIHDRIARQIEGPLPITEIEHDDYVRLAKVIAKAELQTFYKSLSARQAQQAGYGDAAYWQYLDDKAAEYVANGIDLGAFTRSLSEVLQGNDGV